MSAPVWDVPKLFDDGALPWDLLARVKLLANNRNRACWLGYWIAAEEPVIAGSEREMALVLRDAAHGPSRLHAELHGLRPRRLTARRVPHLLRRRLRRHRALRRPRLVRPHVPRALAGHRGDAPRRAGRAVEEAAPRHHLRRDLQAGPGRRGAPRRRGARRRGPLPDRRHHARPRDRRRQGRPLRDHLGRGRARRAGSSTSPTPSATERASVPPRPRSVRAVAARHPTATGRRARSRLPRSARGARRSARRSRRRPGRGARREPGSGTVPGHRSASARPPRGRP